MNRHAALAAGALAAALFGTSEAWAQAGLDASWRPSARLRPWVAAAAGPAKGSFSCEPCGIAHDGTGLATVLAGGLQISDRLAIGGERRTWASLFSESGDRAAVVLGTAQVLAGDSRNVRVAVRAGLGRGHYTRDSGSGTRVARLTSLGGGAALVLFPRASLSPTIALDSWASRGRFPATGMLRSGAVTGVQTSLVVGVVAHH